MQTHLTKAWFYIGITTTALTLGYLVGASNSPVAGSAITAIFGLGIAAVGLLKESIPDGESRAARIPASALRSAGILLTVFSLFYFVAIYGSSVMREKSAQPKPVPIPWDTTTAPSDAQSALQWLVIQRRLMAYGYTANQIKSLYEMLHSMKQAQTPATLMGQDLLNSVPEPGSALKPLIVMPKGILATEPKIVAPPTS